MTIRRLGMPWASPGDRTYSLPSSVIVKLALGEAPSGVPTVNEVRRGVLRPATSLGHAAVDRIVTRFAGQVQACRVHPARKTIGQLGVPPQFDHTEQLTGVARTYLVKTPVGAPIGALTEALCQISEVESASPNYVCVTPSEAPPRPRTDPAGDDAWAPRQLIRAPEAMAYEPGDGAILVGLIDSGVAPEHPEMGGRLRPGYDTVQLGGSDVAPGVTLLGDHHRFDHEPIDHYVGHGMGCAGIIGALGLQMPPGLAGLCQIIPMRALGAAVLPDSPRPIGLGAIADLDAAVKRCVDLGGKVLNMSFGTDDTGLPASVPKPHADVVAYALQRGCILVAASGNNGKETSYWPAAFPGVISVGAVGLDRKPADFSTRSANVALCAPGVRVITSGLTGYQTASGTSFASPFVAAAAALLCARASRRAFPIDADVVRAILVRTAQPFAGAAWPGCGAGFLDAAAALAALDAFIDDQTRDEEGADDG